MKHKPETTEEAILRILHEAETPMGGTQVGRRLAGMGIDLNQRTVRLHMLQLDRRGLTRLVSRRGGRVLTPAGRQEAMATGIVERLDFMATRIDALGYRMNLDPHAGRGSVILNLSFVSEADLARAAPLIREAFAAGLGMGRLMLVRRAGQQVAGLTVRDGEVIIGTVCSFAVNGVLIHAGVPVRARYGGLVEVRAREPAGLRASIRRRSQGSRRSIRGRGGAEVAQLDDQGRAGGPRRCGAGRGPGAASGAVDSSGWFRGARCDIYNIPGPCGPPSRRATGGRAARCSELLSQGRSPSCLRSRGSWSFPCLGRGRRRPGRAPPPARERTPGSHRSSWGPTSSLSASPLTRRR